MPQHISNSPTERKYRCADKKTREKERRPAVNRWESGWPIFWRSLINCAVFQSTTGWRCDQTRRPVCRSSSRGHRAGASWDGQVYFRGTRWTPAERWDVVGHQRPSDTRRPPRRAAVCVRVIDLDHVTTRDFRSSRRPCTATNDVVRACVRESNHLSTGVRICSLSEF